MSFGSFNFGQPQQAPAFGASSAPSLFGAAPSTPFGGQPASAPFGQTSGGMFGATATPAFGQPSTPAFGTPASTPAFGSTGFGAAPTSFGFGASPAFGQSAPAFGSQSTPAFGAQSSAAFGAQPAPAFGASFGGGGGAGAFGGGGAFGAKAAFGAPSSPAFGATATSPPAFGQSPAGFGAATQPFGQTGFGQQQQQPASGTRTVPWRKTAAASDSAGSKSDGNYFSITAMQEYSSKSFEELRWEDYQAGVKGNTGASPTSGAFGQSSGGFGAQSPQPFGTPASGFGAASAPAFGQSPAPAFGASQAPPFGSTGFGSGTPAFGGATPAFGGTAPAFGQSSAPAFGQTPGFGASAPAFGGGFGTAQSSAAFGTAPSNPFGGQSQAAPAFGASGGFTGFGTPQSSPGFGTPQSTPAFGSSGFGSFGQSSGTLAFGGASTPAFGQQQSTPAFSFNTGGGFGTPQQSTAFGASSPATGFGASAPSFGGLFNTNSQQQQQKPGGFGSSFSTFGQTGGAGGFGAASAPAFGQSQAAGGLFAPQPSPGFGSFSQPVQGFGTPGFGQPAQQQQQSQYQAQPQQQLLVADPNLNPYGAMPEPPRIPEYATGLAARPGLGTSLSRSSPLLAPRPISRIMTGSTFGKPPARSRSRSATPAQAEAPSADQAAPSTALVLTPRSNPRHLFVRNQLPSTQASSSDTASPASVTGGKASQEQADEPSSSKQPGPASHAADAEGRRQGPSHSPGRDEMAEEEEEDEDDQQQLSDAQIQQLLPKLESTEFTISPTLAQLAMLVRSGGSSELNRVANFSVTHKAWGSVRWLEPVDVKSLPLKDIVQIAHKNVDVYPANGPTKPDMGEGLNKPAEISLYKIVKRDAKGHVIKQGEDFQKFVQKLKLMASRQSTEFISYDEEREIWKFRVEHFSRYGLFDSDDEEEDGHVEPMQESTPPQPPKDFKGKAAQAAPPKQGYGLFDEDEDMDDDLGSDQTGGVNLDDDDDADRDPEMTSQPMTSEDSMLEDDDMPSSTPRRPHRSPELALALSSGYQHDPQELLDMQQALFAGPDEQAPLPGGKRKSKSVDTAPFIGPATFAEGRAPNAWKRPQPALQPPASILQGEPLGSSSDASALAIIPASPSAGPTAADIAETNGAAASGCLVDAGLMLGQACRACWATNGTLIIPGKGPSQSAITFKHIANLPTPVFPKVDTQASSKDQRLQLKQQQDQQRSNIQQALQLHLDNSSADTPATAGSLTTSRMVPDPEEMEDEEENVPSTSGSAQQPEDRSVPRWRLRCKREAELQSLSKKLADLSTSMLDNADKVQKTVLQQQICTWTLLSVLYTAIEDAPVFNLPDKPSLPEMLRRECLSHWLKEQAAAGMERAYPRNDLSGLAHVAQLLSGHQTAAATVLSASMGDVRLATMVAQAGTSTSGRQLIEQQLDTWQSETWEGETYAHHIDQDRLLIYQILAGQVQQVIPQLDLDWRRALGLHFWYYQPPTASISDLLDSYSAFVSEDRDDVPQPQPLYQEAGGVEPPRSSNAASASDFQLLRLAAGDLPGAQPNDGMAELLRPAGVTPDPLDHSFAWQLLSVLQAIGAFAVEDDDGCPPPQVFHLHMSLISQLEALGDMPHWAVYVALHLPNHPLLGGPLLRQGIVKELLMRHAPDWAADASKQDFLLYKLQVPPAWLDQSLAQWSQYRQDDSGRLQHLLEAELWAEAHQLLCFHLAPQLFFASHSQEGSIPSQQQQDLEDYLRQLIARLDSHAQETGVQSSLQTSAELHAVSWSDGAGLYALYYELRDAFRSSSSDASGQQQRMHDYLQFTQQLQHVATIWSVGSGSTLRQVVLSMLSGCVAHWLLKDASPVLHQQPEEVGLMGYDTSSNMLNVQLAASWLAQRAG